MKFFYFIPILFLLLVLPANAFEHNKKCNVITEDLNILGLILKNGSIDPKYIQDESFKNDNQKLFKSSFKGTVCLPNRIYIPIKKNKIHGKVVYYFENGNISEVISYKSGIPNGKFITYYDNKQIESIGKLKNGLQNGTYIEYYNDGIVKKIIKYSNGNKQGREKIFDTNGNILSSINYVSGKLSGKSLLYRNNKPWSYFYYSDGIIDKVVCASDRRVWEPYEYEHYINNIEIPECGNTK